MQPPEKRPEGLAATSRLKALMANHFLTLDQAARDHSRKIAWSSSVGPAELLRGMGFLVYFPENHGALLGATRAATGFIPYANARGFSPEICSYLTADIGAYLQKKTPLTQTYGIPAVPKPDVLVFNTNQCRDVKDWFSFYAREFGVPLLGIHTHRELGEIRDYQIRDIARQIEELVLPLETISGRKMQKDRLEEAVALSRDTSVLWRKCLEANTSVPAVWTFFDETIHMGPAVVARGTKEAADYYRLLYDELRGRIKGSQGALAEERYRLYWEGMPIWGKLRSLADQFASLKAAVVASTYCSSWIFEQLDPDDPFESMARAYTELFIVRDEEYKKGYLKGLADKFHIDGFVFHDARTCPNNSNNRYGLPERLQEELDIPALTINGDLNDLRCFSEEQTKTNIEAFLEQLAERR